MDGVLGTAAAAATLVGTHFLLSHPLRRPIVGVIGEGGFLGVYSLVAFAALGWLASAYRATPKGAPLWPAGDGLWAVVSLVMLAASILLVGSVTGNPALPNPGAPAAAPDVARGVFAVTRHPMMWSVALWGACHVAVYPVAANIVVAVAMVVLALGGAALQDRKKEALQPQVWRAWEARTSYWPFAAVAAGRARLVGVSWPVLLGGVALWLAATWAHMPLAHRAAGVWRWLA